jgi:hypothetical protein
MKNCFYYRYLEGGEIMEDRNPLITIYGENALDLAFEEIQKLKLNSNIPFDNEYVRLGISFMMLKANEILENKKSHRSLTILVSESFGEAAICKYN